MFFSLPDKEISTYFSCMLNYFLPAQAYLTSSWIDKNCDWGKTLWLEKVGGREGYERGVAKVFLGGERP